VIKPHGTWRNLEAVEFATLEWVDRFDNCRLLEPTGNIPPAEAEARYSQPYLFALEEELCGATVGWQSEVEYDAVR
jgi:hypothetical protein